MSTLGYLFAGYAAVWIGIFLYVRSMAKRQAELDEEVRELRERLGR